MEKRGSFSDESALAKSAAWAWLERRSGGSTPEFDVSRKKCDGTPSRYKAEALKEVEESSNSPREVESRNGHFSLLDRYDIERISRQLDYYIERRSSRCGDGGRRAAVETKSKSGGKKVVKGTWLGLGSPAPLVCGSSRDEVVEMKNIEYSQRRRRRKSSGVGRGRDSASNQVGLVMDSEMCVFTHNILFI